MTHTTLSGPITALLIASASVAAGGLIATAQQPGGTAMAVPAREFGANVTPTFEGWFDNPDGSHNLLIGYYNRNTREELDIPIGPNNRFEPGNPDMGQPTHFLTRRRYGFFVVTVPKEFTKDQKLTWSLNSNGVTASIPFQMHVDYNISPFKASEESPNREFNRPPTLRFAEGGAGLNGPLATGLKAAFERTATVGQPMQLDIFADDDALSANATGATTREPEPVKVEVTKYRGPGAITASEVKLTTTKGGKPMEPYAGKASPTVVFGAPGEYLLHVQALDYSGKGGAAAGGAGCCWTTAIVRVRVANGTGGF
jgi:hypothetical protein